MIQSLDHIAIAVPDLDKAIEEWSRITGATLTHREHIVEQSTFVAFLRIADFRIELIAPDKPDSALGKFLEKRGPGLHHIALKTLNGQVLLNELADKGARLINTSLRPGAEKTMVGFVHPATLDGVLVEVVEHPNK